MRILLLNDYATPTAGAELTTVRLRDALRAKGHDVHVLASRAQLIPGPGFADVASFGTNGRLQPLSSAANPSAARALRRELKAFGPDVVHVNMFMWQLSPSILPPLRNVPSVYYAHTYEAVCPTGSKRLPDGEPCRHTAGAPCWRMGCLGTKEWAPRMLQRLLWLRRRSRLDRVIAVSGAVCARLQEAGIAVDDVVWPGAADAPAGLGPGDRPTVTFAGRLVDEKGVDVLLRAFRAVVDRGHRDALLLVAGTGAREPALRALADRLGLGKAVSWLGQLPESRLAARFAGAWVHAVASSWAEPFGLTGIDAMMRGTAVVVSSTSGIAEVVVDGHSGWHVPPDDAGALASALDRCLSDRPLAARMGAAARARALAVGTVADSAARLVSHYDDAVAQSRPAVVTGDVRLERP